MRAPGVRRPRRGGRQCEPLQCARPIGRPGRRLKGEAAPALPCAPRRCRLRHGGAGSVGGSSGRKGIGCPGRHGGYTGRQQRRFAPACGRSTNPA